MLAIAGANAMLSAWCIAAQPAESSLGTTNHDVLTETATRPTQRETPWWQDPRWFGIALSTALSSLALWRGEQGRRRSEAIDEFNAVIRDPLRDAHKELRTLALKIAVAADLIDLDVRKAEIKKIREEIAGSALTTFMLTLQELDRRLGTRGEWADIGATLEDEVYQRMPELELQHAQHATLRTLSNAMGSAIQTAIQTSDGRLDEVRPVFVRNYHSRR